MNSRPSSFEFRSVKPIHLLSTLVVFCALANFMASIAHHRQINAISSSKPFKYRSNIPPAKRKVIPPYILAPAQASNNFETFEAQCLQHCLSAYEASSTTKAADDVEEAAQLRSYQPPRILHFIFIGEIGQDQFVQFTFTDYLVIRAAYFRLQPDEIYMHTNMPPLDSPLWDLIQPMISVRKHLEPITEIYGNKVTGKAHFSDIARLQVLQAYGGIYMDIDSISLRPFTKEMWDPPSGITMGYEDRELSHIGCGVIVARNDSKYLKRWLESYRTFDDTRWCDHTVIMAGKLAKEFPSEINVLPETHFYRPSWRPDSMKLLWDTQPRDDINMVNFSLAYAPHYWGTLARMDGKIKRMTPATVLSENAGIHQILRPLLPNPYFSVLLHCDVDEDSYWKVQNSLDSIVKQSFPLWEIMLVEKSQERTCSNHVMENIVPRITRLQKYLPKSIRMVHVPSGQSVEQFSRGVWMLDIEAGHELSNKDVFETALNHFRDNSDKRVWHHDGEKRFQFVFEPSKGVSRV